MLWNAIQCDAYQWDCDVNVMNTMVFYAINTMVCLWSQPTCVVRGCSGQCVQRNWDRDGTRRIVWWFEYLNQSWSESAFSGLGQRVWWVHHRFGLQSAHLSIVHKNKGGWMNERKNGFCKKIFWKFSYTWYTYMYIYPGLKYISLYECITVSIDLSRTYFLYL